ncbi:MAG: DNA repair protein RecN [Desulfobulbaceae bacterium]
MLLELRIENMALIDRLELALDEGGGLLVLTGETGAGKSIILQAIHLLAGDRGAASWIRTDREQAVVEALFSIRPDHEELRDMLRENGIEDGDECVVRRVFNRNGRSRFSVNGRLVTAGMVGRLMENLVSIASQHDHQQLLSPRRHLDFLDTYGELWELRREFSRLFSKWQQLSRERDDLRAREEDKEQRRDFLTFQVREIEAAGTHPGEDEELVEERNRLKSSSTLNELAGNSLRLLRDGMLDNLVEIRRNMEQVGAIDKSAAELAERIVSACYEVEDLELALRDYLQNIPDDSSRLDAISERLTLLRQLQRKYGPTLEDVLAHGERAAAELASLEDMDREIDRLEKEVAAVREEMMVRAGELSAGRRRAAELLGEAMQDELRDLCFTRAAFEVAVTGKGDGNPEDLQATGMDEVTFLFSANPGEPVKPLARIASGGELSRLMLALKCLLARRDQVETVVFDEVDAGIGGKAAEAVARKIEELAGHHQVFCITHLPQIAARADHHFMVAKLVDGGRTVSTIRRLDGDDRVMELARMLGGENLTSRTIAYARELVGCKVGGAAP